MPSHVFQIESGHFGFSLTDPAITDPCTATMAAFSPDYQCSITSGALTASPNVSTDTVPATWCAPEESIPNVGITSYSLDLDYLQSPDVIDGLSRFLFENDTNEAWFFIGLDGDDPPKAIGKVRLVSGAIGGPGRTALTASVSLPVVGKPSVCFGDATASVAITGNVTGVTAGTPGSFTPSTAPIPADLAALQALGSLGQTTAWATGESVVLGDASDAHWDGAAWAAGVAT